MFFLLDLPDTDFCQVGAGVQGWLEGHLALAELSDTICLMYT